MAYNLSATVILGAGNTGLTLTASLFDSANASAAGLTTSTLVEVTAGSGTYLWTGTVPDGHRGYLRFDSSGTFKAAVSLNAQEVENPDVKTSTRSSHTPADVWANATRTLTSFGTLTTDTAAAVWAAGSRTLTSFGTLAADVWAVGTRTLSAFGFSVDLLQSAADKVWLSASRTLTSLGTVVADTAAAVWAYATRTLTMSAAQIAALLDGTTMTITRGDTISIPVTGLGSLSGRTKLSFTVKDQTSDADTAAIIQIEETAGLVRLNGAAATANQGSLTVTDVTNGNITLALTPAASSLLSAPRNYRYDVQKIAGSAVSTLTQGTFIVNPDVTRGIV